MTLASPNKKRYFGSGTDQLGVDWSTFKDTSQVPVSEKLLDWVVGQDNVLEECYLFIDEWIRKMKRVISDRPTSKGGVSATLRSKGETLRPPKRKIEPGPYLLLLGDPGTGKSLIGQALSEYMTERYKQEGIRLEDVLAEKNKRIPSQPKIRRVPAGEGHKIVTKELARDKRKGFAIRIGLKAMITSATIVGVSLFAAFWWFVYGFVDSRLSLWESRTLITEGLSKGAYLIQVSGGERYIVHSWLEYFRDILISAFIGNVQLAFFSIMILSFGIVGFFLGRQFGTSAGQAIGNLQQTNAPNLIVDNSEGKAPFIDATGAQTSTLFGDIAWDPYQTGGLGTPEHQRVTAGLVHKAHMGVLYIDEVRNLSEQAVINLLTVLEDGELPITLRSHWGEGGSAAMNVKSEPAPAMFFFVAAGNFDSLPHLHPALKDRFYGYGRVIRMNNYMPREEDLHGKSTTEIEQLIIDARRRIVQFVAQEIYRFHLPPADYSACVEICEEARRRSDRNYAYTTKFRPLIGVIRIAGQLALRDKSPFITAEHIRQAVTEHSKSIEKQILEEMIESQRRFQHVITSGHRLGRVNGLVVLTDEYSKEKTGNLVVLKAYARKLTPAEQKLGKGVFKVTGLPGEMLRESSQKVLSVILKKYGVNLERDYYTHIDFAQSQGVEGPSAGVAMAIALASILEKRPVRQDTAVTGEVNIIQEPCTQCLEVTPVGGLYEKIKAAEKWGMKRVIIPQANYEYSVNPADFDIEVIGAATLEEYLDLILADHENHERMCPTPSLTVQSMRETRET